MPETCRNSPLLFFFLFVHITILLLFALQPHHARANEQLVSEILQLASQGDRQAQFSMGLRYDTGDGVERDPQQAAAWFKKAASAGLAGACLYLGMKYEFGAGVSRDTTRAIYWYEQAAIQGWPQAAFLVGTLYLKSSPPVLKKGCDWLRAAAAQDYPGAEEAQQQAACPGFPERNTRNLQEPGNLQP